MELTNGCICCTVADDFLPTMEMLLARETPPEHIVIETSGLALPQPLVRAFSWPSVKTKVTVDGVVTVLDAAALAEAGLPLMKPPLRPSAQPMKRLITKVRLRNCFAISCAALTLSC